MIQLAIFVSDFGSKPYLFFPPSSSIFNFFLNSRQTKTYLKTRDKSNSDETAVPAPHDSTQAGDQQEKRVTSTNRAEETEVTGAQRRRDGERSIQTTGWQRRFHPNLELRQTYEDTGWRDGTQVSFMLATTL